MYALTKADAQRTQSNRCLDTKGLRIQAHYITKGHEKTWSVDDAQ